MFYFSRKVKQTLLNNHVTRCLSDVTSDHKQINNSRCHNAVSHRVTASWGLGTRKETRTSGGFFSMTKYTKKYDKKCNYDSRMKMKNIRQECDLSVLQIIIHAENIAIDKT